MTMAREIPNDYGLRDKIPDYKVVLQHCVQELYNWELEWVT